MRPSGWKASGFSMSRLVAYDREVMGQLQSLEKNDGDIDAEPVPLSENYVCGWLRLRKPTRGGWDRKSEANPLITQAERDRETAESWGQNRLGDGPIV